MTTNHRALLIALIALGAVPCLAEAAEKTADNSTTQAKAEEGFTPLFDGTSLDGWWLQDKVPKFHVGGRWDLVDGIMVGQQHPPGKGGFFATKGKYGDFILRLEVNMDYPSDSGIFVRMADGGNSHQITLDNRPDGQFGKIYLPWTQEMVHESPDGIKHFKQKEWNDVEVRVEGEPSRIRFWLNGDLVTDFQHTAETTKGVPATGYIALQVHPFVEGIKHFEEGNKVRYRNIRIRPLEASEVEKTEK